MMAFTGVLLVQLVINHAKIVVQVRFVQHAMTQFTKQEHHAHVQQLSL